MKKRYSVIASIVLLGRASVALAEQVPGPPGPGTGPSAVANDLTWLGVVLRAAKASCAILLWSQFRAAPMRIRPAVAET